MVFVRFKKISFPVFGLISLILQVLLQNQAFFRRQKVLCRQKTPSLAHYFVPFCKRFLCALLHKEKRGEKPNFSPRFFFSETEDQDILRVEILELEAEVRKYKDLVDDYILQTRRAEIKQLEIGN